jgi:hypothetical protein
VVQRGEDQLAFNRTRQAEAERLCGIVQRSDARRKDYNEERPHSALGYETPAAFAAELNKQWPVPLRPSGAAPQAIASPAPMRNNLTLSRKMYPV